MAVIVFGSANVDLVMPVPTFPMPGETVLTQDYHAVPGGKGANQALAVKRAGVPANFVGAVGKDHYADCALSLLREASVGLEATIVSDRPTGCAVVMVDAEGENSIVVASGANLDVRAHQVSDALLKSNRVLVLQQEVSFEENESLGCRAQQAGLQIVLNLAPATQIPTGLLANTNFLIVNEVEAAFLAGEQTQVSMTDLADHLADTYDCGTLITLGNEGCVVASGDERAFGVDAPGVEVVDTTGAGDTFTGYFAALLAQEHLSLRQCVAGATQAASLACTRMGAQSGIPCAEDVLRARDKRQNQIYL